MNVFTPLTNKIVKVTKNIYKPVTLVMPANKPWFKSLVQKGRTCTNGANFCLSASNSARYLSNKHAVSITVATTV
jgi:hypothetical protein